MNNLYLTPFLVIWLCIPAILFPAFTAKLKLLVFEVSYLLFLPSYFMRYTPITLLILALKANPFVDSNILTLILFDFTWLFDIHPTLFLLTCLFLGLQTPHLSVILPTFITYSFLVPSLLVSSALLLSSAAPSNYPSSLNSVLLQ